jgi:hypothetical protein
MPMTRLFRALAIQFLAMTIIVHAADDMNIVAEVIGRFRPSKPTVIMSYDVTYVLLRVRLKRVAGATIKATEGVWRSSISNTWTPACVIDFQVVSPRTGDDKKENNISLFKRTVSVLTMPDLKIITYAKQNDEFIKPFFRKGRRNKYIEIYNFKSGALTYRHHDLVSGAVETNLPGMADLAKQSTEVADVLQTLYAAYHGKSAAEHSVANKVHFNVDGVVRTFELKMKEGRVSVPVLSRKLSALYADVQPEEDSDSLDESFSMWCVPFREFSKETTDPELKNLAETSLECSMLPLSGEYSLFLGAIQCTLTNIFVQR